MSLIAVIVGVALGLSGRVRAALAGAAATWAVTTLYLVFAARASAGEDRLDHAVNLGFWIVQVGILVVSLVAAWGTSKLRSAQLHQA